MTFFRGFPSRSPAWRLVTVYVLAGSSAIWAAGSAEAPQESLDKLRCGPGIANHPVRMVPSGDIKIPRGWPLDSDGSMSCLTCHSKVPSLPGDASPNLRDFNETTDAAVDFCAKCHAAADTRSAVGMHWLAVRVAHVKPQTNVSGGSGGLLDAESRRCLGCHDGVNATESTNPSATQTHQFRDMQRNHPIGVRYSDRARRNPGAQLRPAQLLPVRVQLPGGQVSCISCHNLYQRAEHRLSVPIEGSELCFTCHQME